MLAAAALGLVAWQWPAATPPVRPKLASRGQDHERARAEWFLRDRRALDGRLPAAHLLRAFQQKRLLQHVYPRPWSAALRRELFGSRRLAALQPTVGNWTELGPSPQTGMDFIQVSGRITSLALDLTDDPTGNTIYLGAAYGGIWQSINALSANPTWTAISDTAPSLAIGAIALLPGTNPPVVIAGTGEQNNSIDSYYGIGFERGVYDSSTSSWNWTAISTATSQCGGCAGTTTGQSLPLLGLAFAKILVLPGTNTVLAAGGSSADISSLSLVNQYYRGIYRSTDGGQTWSLVFTQGDANGTNYSCTDLLYDAKNGAVYAALRGHGIYQSTDGGTTWQAVATPTPFVDPASANLDQEFHRASLAVDSSGNLFAIITDINGELATPTACGSGGGSNCDTGIWESPDGGKTWNPIASPTCGNLNAKYTQTCSTADPLFNADNQGDYDMYIAVAPSGSSASDTLVVGGIDVWSATPAGMSTTWTDLTLAYGPGIVHPDQHAIAFVSANTWFVGNDGGIWSTTNAGDPGAAGTSAAGSTSAWADLNNGIGTIQLISATPDPAHPGVYTGGSQDNGTVISTASTGTIWGLGWGGDGGNTAIDPANPQDYFSENSFVPTPPPTCGAPGPNCAGPGSIIVASTNGGKPTNYTGPGSSSYPPCGWPGNGNFANDINVLANCVPSYAPVLDTNLLAENGDFYLPFKLIPNNTSAMLLATCRLWMGPALPASPDQGWVPISPDLTSDNAPAGACGTDYIQEFAAIPENSAVVYAVTTDGQIQETNNAYASPPVWVSQVQSPLPTDKSLPFGAVAGNASGTVYLGVQGFVAGTGYGHVYMESSGGNWTDITGNLPDVPVNAIAVDPEIPNDIYAGTDVGVFVATDGGVSGEVWQQMGSGLPSSAVLDLKIDDATRTLIAGTHGRGAWAIPLLGTPQPGFTLNSPDTSVYVTPGAGTVQLTVGAAAQGGFNGMISLTCAGCSPASLSPGSTASLTLSVGAVLPATVSVVGTSTGAAASSSLVFNLLPATFALNATPSDPVVTAGSSATVTASVLPQGPFAGTVNLSCPGQGSGITCAVSPATVQIANGKAATAAVTITTTAAGVLPPLVPEGNGGGWFWALLAALALALAAAVAARRWGRRPGLAYWLAPVVLAGFLILTACGGGNGGLPPTSGGGGGGGSTPATPAGAYSLSLQATSGGQTQTFTIILTVH